MTWNDATSLIRSKETQFHYPGLSGVSWGPVSRWLRSSVLYMECTLFMAANISVHTPWNQFIKFSYCVVIDMGSIPFESPERIAWSQHAIFVAASKNSEEWSVFRQIPVELQKISLWRVEIEKKAWEFTATGRVEVSTARLKNDSPRLDSARLDSADGFWNWEKLWLGRFVILWCMFMCIFFPPHTHYDCRFDA